MAKTKRFQFSFERWIIQFRKENSGSGMIARLVYSNYAFSKSNNKRTIKNYMKNKDASNDVLKIIDSVWSEFEKHQMPYFKIPNYLKTR